jgi:hypothetical protein
MASTMGWMKVVILAMAAVFWVLVVTDVPRSVSRVELGFTAVAATVASIGAFWRTRKGTITGWASIRVPLMFYAVAIVLFGIGGILSNTEPTWSNLSFPVVEVLGGSVVFVWVLRRRNLLPQKPPE